MDGTWRLAPLPAIWVDDDTAAPRIELNDCALQWQREGRLTQGDVARLLQQCRAPGDHEVRLGVADVAQSCRVVPVGGARLLWLSPQSPEAATRIPLAEQLALAQQLGGLGVWMRDLDTGEAWWDPQVYRIFDLDPGDGPPTVEWLLTERVHPDDAAAFRERVKQRRGAAGRYGARWRVRQRNGQVRHVTAAYEVRMRDDGRAGLIFGVLVDDTEAVEALQAQHEASELLRQALRLSNISVWHIDPAQQRIRFAQFAPGMAPAGFTDDGDLTLQSQRDTIHPDDLERVTRAAQQALNEGGVVDAVARYAAPGGGWRTLLTRRVAHRERDGNRGLLGISIDLSELVAERAFASHLAEHMRLAAEALGLGFWTRDIDAGEAAWDEQMYSLHHRDPAEGPPSLDEWLARHVHPLDRDWMRQHQMEAHGQWTEHDEVLFRVPVPGSDEVRWIQGRTRRIIRDGRRQSYGVHVDVTERQLMQLALERERERVAFALDAAGVGVWERRLDGGPGYLSAVGRRLRGYGDDLSMPAEDVVVASISGEDMARSEAAIRRHVEHGDDYNHEFEVRWPDGSVHWLASRGRVVRDTLGRPLYLAGINIDITERKLAEALARDKLRLEQASRARGEFLARMSHELRTPLNAVLGFAQLLDTDTVDSLTPRQRAWVQRIDTAGRSLLTMFDELLQLAREQSPAVAEPAPAAQVATGSPALRLLCVEDNPVNVLLLRELMALRPQLCSEICEDGSSALARAIDFAPQVLLLDLQLPDMTGLELMRQLRAMPALAQARFIALSANAMPQDVQAALDAGFDDYWTKPIDVREFLGALDTLIAAPRPALG